jgi:putative heme-binding domain-containing protein
MLGLLSPTADRRVPPIRRCYMNQIACNSQRAKLPCIRFLSIATIVLFFIAHQSFAVKPSDTLPAESPVTEGLVVYFDAITPEAADTVANAEDKSPLAMWNSVSGTNLQVGALSNEGTPERIRVGDGWVVRFDGQDDALRVTKTGLTLNSSTIFVVAAPHSNLGEFRGLVAGNAPEKRDYESGLNIDLGPGPTFAFEQLNLEGKGFSGAANLRQHSSPMGRLHILETTIDAANSKVSLKVDGTSEGSRELKPETLSLDELTIGARFYTNGPGEQQVRGHYHGDLAAVLIYSRVLSDDEATNVRNYLEQRFIKLNDALQSTLPTGVSQGVPLVKAKSPPPIKMLVPGFTIAEIPLELTNVNNVKYGRDGRLVTLGYNGDMHLLSDTDGDGLEDKAELFWKNEGSIRGPLGMVLTPANYAKGQGVILASKGKISMIVDRDGDDKGDEELTVASGWQEIPQNVDAVGLTMDGEGNLYFGLGTANYANAYLVDEAGQAKYDVNSERGTVQKISPDWSKRETICTGIRFPIAFGFNHQGDLFCTEQEGATWLPNGNPLDELLHIRLDGQAPSANPTGKQHFGFPPRHPRHNPTVIDEPSVFEYGPQHQSTCGMVFNESVNGGPIFGIKHWQDNAIVCGESRGKIWRTKLVKTPSGYVAESQLLACLQMLTVDACVAPNGDLVVACHSGPPDWGTGPQGIGKLFRIRMSQPDVPRPIATWAATPSELQITFDQPLNPELVRGLATRARVEFGVNVRAGDRFENLVPPYAVVRQQLIQPRFELPVHSVAVSPDSRTLTLHTDVISQPVHHAIRLPLGDDEIEVDSMPRGLQASWTAKGATVPQWQGYLPHPDLDVCRSLLKESTFHETLWPLLEQDGTLRLETWLDYRNMLRPIIQLGAQIDYEWPVEETFVKFTSPNSSLFATAITRNSNSRAQSDKAVALDLIEGDEFARVNVELETKHNTAASLTVSFSTAEDATERALPLRRFFQPWAPIEAISAETKGISNRETIPELVGGSWGRGRRLFHDSRTQCSKCHAVDGDGPKIGPDLGNLVHRDYTSVLKDIVEPSRAINPDYLTHVISTSDGQVLTGVVSSDGDQLVVADAKGEVKRIVRDDVEQMKPTGASVMPVELLNKLNDAERRDLLTYLLTSPPKMPSDSPMKAPPVRTRAEVAAILKDSQPLPEELKKLNIVLIDGVQDHGPGEHDYPAWQRVWAELLAAGQQVEVSTVRDFPDKAQLEAADVLIFFQKGSFSLQREVEFDKFLKRGGGAVFIHWAVNGDDRVGDFAKRIGLASWGSRISYRHGPLSLKMVNRQHPILRNFDAKLELYDESYWKLTGDMEKITLLATSVEDGQPTPQMWLREHDAGRVFVSIPGHYSWTFDDPLFRVLLLRGIAWTAKQPLDRFNELVTPGARISK